MKNAKMVTGLVLIDAPASALNNAGVPPELRDQNRMVVKKIRKGREEFPYVSGQAFKRWWRDTIHRKYDWTSSPIFREENIAYTMSNPIKYEEDDIFGYMLAPREKIEQLGLVSGLAYRRVAPLKCTPLVSLFGNVITLDHFASFARGPAEAEPVPYEQEFYSTVLKGAFSLMLTEVGYFSRGRAKDLPAEDDAEQALKGKQKDQKAIQRFKSERLASIIAEANSKGATVNPQEIEMPVDERKRRVRETLLSLSDLTGGAKTANYLTDVSPKFIIAAAISCANHIFMDTINARDGKPTLNVDTLNEIVKDYKDNFLSPIFIGLRKGFVDEQEYNKVSQITKLEGISVSFGTPKGAISRLVNRIDEIDL